MRFIGIDNLEEKSSIVPTHVGVNRFIIRGDGEFIALSPRMWG